MLIDKRLIGLITRNMIEKILEGKNDIDISTLTAETIMRKFDYKKKYHPITPETPLIEIDEFFKTKCDVAFVTMADKWCCGVVTPLDLQKFALSRGGANAVGAKLDSVSVPNSNNNTPPGVTV